MAINDLYHVQVFQRVLGQTEPVITNWFYAAVDLLGDAQALVNGFKQAGGMLEKINDFQSSNMVNVSIKAYNLFSLTDFVEEGLTGGGDIGGEMLPVFCGVSFTKKLDTRGVRPGRVNVPGIPEAVTNISIISDAGYTALGNLLATAMAADVVETLGATFDPVVIKRVEYEVEEEGVGTGRMAYRLPANSGEANFGHVTAALWSPKVSHVVTRGNGR